MKRKNYITPYAERLVFSAVPYKSILENLSLVGEEIEDFEDGGELI